MMKYWLALLVLLNALVLAWQLNALAPWGFGPGQDREPERLEQQIKPEALQFESVPSKSVAETAETAETMAPDAQPLPGAGLSSDPVDGLGSAGVAEGANTNGQGALEVQGVQEGVQGATSPAGAAPNSVLPVSPVLAPPPTALPAQPTVPAVGSGQVN